MKRVQQAELSGNAARAQLQPGAPALEHSLSVQSCFLPAGEKLA